MVTVDDFKGIALLPESKSRSLRLMHAVVCKTQASKHYTVSLPSVLKDKKLLLSKCAAASCSRLLFRSRTLD